MTGEKHESFCSRDPFFFGISPMSRNLWLINMFSLSFGLLLAWGVPAIRDHTSRLQKLLILLLAWDDQGGVVANLKAS